MSNRCVYRNYDGLGTPSRGREKRSRGGRRGFRPGAGSPSPRKDVNRFGMSRSDEVVSSAPRPRSATPRRAPGGEGMYKVAGRDRSADDRTRVRLGCSDDITCLSREISNASLLLESTGLSLVKESSAPRPRSATPRRAPGGEGMYKVAGRDRSADDRTRVRLGCSEDITCLSREISNASLLLESTGLSLVKESSAPRPRSATPRRAPGGEGMYKVAGRDRSADDRSRAFSKRFDKVTSSLKEISDASLLLESTGLSLVEESSAPRPRSATPRRAPGGEGMYKVAGRDRSADDRTRVRLRCSDDTKFISKEISNASLLLESTGQSLIEESSARRPRSATPRRAPGGEGMYKVAGRDRSADDQILAHLLNVSTSRLRSAVAWRAPGGEGTYRVAGRSPDVEAEIAIFDNNPHQAGLFYSCFILSSRSTKSRLAS
jgi:hypothetical protein